MIGGSSGAQRCDMVVIEKSIFALKRVRVSVRVSVRVRVKVRVSCSECRMVSPRS